jgi:hypothetical protein
MAKASSPAKTAAPAKPQRTSRGVSMGMNTEAPVLPQTRKDGGANEKRNRPAKSGLQPLDQALKRFLAPVGSDGYFDDRGGPDEVYFTPQDGAPAGFGEIPQAAYGAEAGGGSATAAWMPRKKRWKA